jgi:hypothetical protein
MGPAAFGVGVVEPLYPTPPPARAPSHSLRSRRKNTQIQGCRPMTCAPRPIPIQSAHLPFSRHPPSVDFAPRLPPSRRAISRVRQQWGVERPCLRQNCVNLLGKNSRNLNRNHTPHPALARGPGCLLHLWALGDIRSYVARFWFLVSGCSFFLLRSQAYVLCPMCMCMCMCMCLLRWVGATKEMRCL